MSNLIEFVVVLKRHLTVAVTAAVIVNLRWLAKMMQHLFLMNGFVFQNFFLKTLNNPSRLLLSFISLDFSSPFLSQVFRSVSFNWAKILNFKSWFKIYAATSFSKVKLFKLHRLLTKHLIVMKSFAGTISIRHIYF